MTDFNATNFTWQGVASYIAPAYNAADFTWQAIELEVVAGHFTLDATPSGTPWLARVQAGSFVLDATPQVSDYLLHIPVVAGHFILAADLPLGAAFVGVPIVVGAFTLDSALSGKYGLAVANAGFTLHAKVRLHDTFLGYFQICGPFTLAPALTGNFERLIWWLDAPPASAQKIYTCILTGSPDIILPISSLQIRMYDTGRSAVTVVVPNAPLYAQQIADRITGTLIIRQGYRYTDGSEQLAELARSSGVSLRYDTGARNSSCTISTSAVTAFAFDPAVEKRIDSLTGFFLQADGNIRLRTIPIFGLYPGDQVLYDGTLYPVKSISVAIGSTVHSMEVLSG